MLVAALLDIVVIQILFFFSLLLLLRVLLTWLPGVPWENPLLATLAAVTDPYLNLFRGLVRPVAGLNLSPILAFLLLSVTSWLLGKLSGPLLDNASYTRYVVG